MKKFTADQERRTRRHYVSSDDDSGKIARRIIGAGEGIRTPDQRLGKPMRYPCATPATIIGERLLF